MLITLVKKFGNDYDAILRYFPGRTRKMLKDFWHNTNRTYFNLWNIIPKKEGRLKKNKDLVKKMQAGTWSEAEKE